MAFPCCYNCYKIIEPVQSSQSDLYSQPTSLANKYQQMESIGLMNNVVLVIFPLSFAEFLLLCVWNSTDLSSEVIHFQDYFVPRDVMV